MIIKDDTTGKNIVGNPKVEFINSKIHNFFLKLKKIIIGSTIPQKLFRTYFLIVIISAVLLCCPFCLQVVDGVQINGFKNKNYNFIKALFVACSAFSNTGLTPIIVFKYFNFFGQLVLLLTIEIGGMGTIALFYWIWSSIKNVFFQKKMKNENLEILQVLQSERGGNKLSESGRIISIAFIFMFAVQILFAIIYSLCYCLIPAYQQIGIDEKNKLFASYNDYSQPLKVFHNYGHSLWVGIFTSVSVINNAGFDIISNSSIAPYRNDWGTILQMFIMLELIIGGIGHFIAFDIIEKILHKIKKKSYSLTLFTKLSLSMYFAIGLLGIFFTYICEWMAYDDPTSILGYQCKHGEFGKCEMYNKCFCVLYNIVDARCLGMNSIDCKLLSKWSKWVYCISMLIGGAPSSTAGGIRVTTIAVIFATIWSKLKGRKNVIFLKKTLDKDLVIEAFIILISSIILIFICSMIFWSSLPAKSWSAVQKNYRFTDVFFEVSSAFGTVGSSMGFTAIAKWWGLLSLTILMFIGQLGIINTLLSWTGKKTKYDGVVFPKENIKLQ